MTGRGAGGAGVAGIVLAGGRSSRFGRDKLLEPLDGRPLLHHVLLALAPAVDEIVLVVRPNGAPPRLPGRDALAVPLRVVRDPEPFGGPLVGLAAGLRDVGRPLALAVAGDMPGIRVEVLRAMLSALDEPDADLVVLAGPGPFQTVPAALRVAPARAAATAALDAGGRALRALYDRLRIRIIPEAQWQVLDPGGATLRDVDLPEDLAGLR